MDLFEVGHVGREGEREPIAAVPQRHVGARTGRPLKRLPEVGGGRRAGRLPGDVLDTPTDDQRAVPATISWNPRIRPSAAGFQ